MAKLTMMLNRGKKLPQATFTATVDPETLTEQGVYGLVLKDIQGNRDKASHVVLAADGLKTYNPENGLGCSLRRFLLGPNYRTRVKSSASTDYTRAAFFTVLEPVLTNQLIAVMRDLSTSKYAIRYYDVTLKKCITIMTTKTELRKLVKDTVGHELSSEFNSWFERKPYEHKPKAEVVEPVITPPAETGAAVIEVVDSDGQSQMAISKQLELPAGTKPIEVEINIPIPYTGLFITVKVTTK